MERQIDSTIPSGMKSIGISFLLMLFGYGVMFLPHYSVDSYSVFQNLWEIKVSGIKAGRAAYVLWHRIFQLLDLNPVQKQWFGTLLLILACALAHVMIFRAVLKVAPAELSMFRKTVLFGTLLIAFCNPFLLEWFIYVEITPMYATGVLFSVWGAVMLIMDNPKAWLLAWIGATAAVLCYQVTVSFFLIFGAVLILVQYDFRPGLRVLKKMAGCALLGGIACATAVLCARVLPLLIGIEPRASRVSVTGGVRFVLSVQKRLWKNTLGLTPDYLIAAAAAVALVVLAFGMFRENRKNVWWTMFVLAGCYTAVFLSCIGSGEYWLTARICVPFFAFVSMLLCMAVLRCPVGWLTALGAVTVLVFGTLVWQNDMILQDQLYTNRVDQQECLQIEAAISGYEESTGNQVTKIAVFEDEQVTYTYPGVTHHFAELNQRCMSVPWAITSVLEFYTGRQLVPVSERPAASGFEGENWSSFDPSRQLIFHGDTVYFCIY